MMLFSFPSSAECLECIIHATLSRNEIRCCSHSKAGEIYVKSTPMQFVGNGMCPFKRKG